MEKISDTRKQAKYIDDKTTELERKLGYPSLIFKKEKITNAEAILETEIKKNEEMLVRKVSTSCLYLQ